VSDCHLIRLCFKSDKMHKLLSQDEIVQLLGNGECEERFLGSDMCVKSECVFPFVYDDACK
jgi:hypothetical protein